MRLVLVSALVAFTYAKKTGHEFDSVEDFIGDITEHRDIMLASEKNSVDMEEHDFEDIVKANRKIKGEKLVEVDAEEWLAEFFESVDQDPMLKHVISQLNGLMAVGETKSMVVNSAGEFCEEEDDDPVCAERTLPTGEEAAQQQELTDSVGQLKRFIELKQLISWMQPKDKRISRYCFYGCWCLPEGAHSFVAGEGRPVDLVDKACQNMWFCYTCAKQEFRGVFAGKQRECTPDKIRYTFKFKYDKFHPGQYSKRDIICKDLWYSVMDSKNKQRSNCARAVCECDRGLAMRLYYAWRAWDKSRHRIWSQKVTSCKQLSDCALISNPTAKAECLKRGCLFIVKRRCLTADNPGDEPNDLTCCGRYENNGSRWETRDHGGQYACCSKAEGSGTGLPWDGYWFNQVTHCCKDGDVLAGSSGNCI